MIPPVGLESIRRGAISGVVVASAVCARLAPRSLSSTANAATAADDPLGCSAQADDPAAVPDPTLAGAATTAARLGADLHVRIERSLDGDIVARELLLERQWTS